jgi:hypothetical protein
LQDPEGSGKPFFYQSSEKIPIRGPNNLQIELGALEVNDNEEPKNVPSDSDKIEFSGIGIFGGDESETENEKTIQEKVVTVSDEESAEYVDDVTEFGARQPGFRRPSQQQQQQQRQQKQQQQQQVQEEEEGSFTFRRGRLPPRKSSTTTRKPTTERPTTQTPLPSSVETDAEDVGLDIGGDLGGSEEENSFFKGQRLIPNHVFESPSLPIRQQVKQKLIIFHIPIVR